VDVTPGSLPRFASLPFRDGKLSAIRFVDASTLVVATAGGSIYDVSMQDMTFVTMKGTVR